MKKLFIPVVVFYYYIQFSFAQNKDYAFRAVPFNRVKLTDNFRLPGEKENKVNAVKRAFITIPYYAWANHGKNEMTSWFPERIKDIEIVSQ